MKLLLPSLICDFLPHAQVRKAFSFLFFGSSSFLPAVAREEAMKAPWESSQAVSQSARDDSRKSGWVHGARRRLEGG